MRKLLKKIMKQGSDRSMGGEENGTESLGEETKWVSR